jgi:hypothetical protein
MSEPLPGISGIITAIARGPRLIWMVEPIARRSGRGSTTYEGPGIQLKSSTIIINDVVARTSDQTEDGIRCGPAIWSVIETIMIIADSRQAAFAW